MEDITVGRSSAPSGGPYAPRSISGIRRSKPQALIRGRATGNTRAAVRPLGDDMPAGRPTDYSVAIADEFCRRVAGGRSVLAVCGDTDMPSDTTVYRWRQEKPEFRDKLTCARDDRLEAYADRMDALARRVIEDLDLDPQRVNAAVNAIDKAARLQSPKQRVEIGGPNGGPIEMREVSDLDRAKAMAFLASKAKREVSGKA